MNVFAPETFQTSNRVTFSDLYRALSPSCDRFASAFAATSKIVNDADRANLQKPSEIKIAFRYQSSWQNFLGYPNSNAQSASLAALETASRGKSICRRLADKLAAERLHLRLSVRLSRKQLKQESPLKFHASGFSPAS